MKTHAWLVYWALVATMSASGALAQPPGFKFHGKFVGIGACLNTAIAPGPEPGSQRLYASHIYGGDTLDVVATDPLTGKTDVFSSPVPSSS
jgi:hypothetical protein